MNTATANDPKNIRIDNLPAEVREKFKREDLEKLPDNILAAIEAVLTAYGMPDNDDGDKALHILYTVLVDANSRRLQKKCIRRMYCTKK